ncbi:hypothetical protein B0H12DRAFT_1216533 [Mycena haematopus]|nr:hypothetical protein B0H12DRAFT_1216533 [Mycena haematopus]
MAKSSAETNTFSYSFGNAEIVILGQAEFAAGYIAFGLTFKHAKFAAEMSTFSTAENAAEFIPFGNSFTFAESVVFTRSFRRVSFEAETQVFGNMFSRAEFSLLPVQCPNRALTSFSRLTGQTMARSIKESTCLPIHRDTLKSSLKTGVNSPFMTASPIVISAGGDGAFVVVYRTPLNLKSPVRRIFCPRFELKPKKDRECQSNVPEIYGNLGSISPKLF